ncbi:hypothetical protein KJZ63_04745 [Patescibacteria group bacterium]|nr:hypothetical protein [Patescibacteria group bacterium]
MKRLSSILALIITASLFVIALPAQAQNWSECPDAPSRIGIGDTASVSDADSLPLALHRFARSSSTVLAQIPIRTELLIIDGPRCNDGWGFWKVSYNNKVGWVGEVGPEGLYNLIPVNTESCPTIDHAVEIGDRARVTPGLGNRIRAEADLDSEQIGTARPGVAFRVLDGPVCSDGFWWWKISYPRANGTGRIIGWTVEGDTVTGEAWIEPVN